MKRYIGIDVSKKNLVVAFPVDDKYQKFTIKTYENTTKGVGKLMDALPENCHCVLEATGNYSLLLSYELVEAKIDLSVINPKSSRHFFIMMQSTVKSDSQDAKMLAVYGHKLKPEVFKPKAKTLLLLQQKRLIIKHLIKSAVNFKNLKESFQAAPFCEEETMEMLDMQIKELDKKVNDLQEQITQIARKDFEHLYDLLISIPSVGHRLASAIIVATNGFKGFDSAKQLAKFLGLAPTYYQSGTSMYVKGKINRSGAPDVRAILYMCAVNSLRFNPLCQQLYRRLKANGKPSMIAMVAVMHKLVRIIFGVVKNNKPFDLDWVSNLK